MTTGVDPQLRFKEEAGLRAADLVASGMVVGLGTGSTARFAVEEIGRRLEQGTLRDVVGIPTSTATETHARACGIPLVTLEQHPTIDLTIDGADEVDPKGDLVKGAGGALLWEKIVASRSRRLVIAVDPTKLVERLGTKAALPVEVVPFGWSVHLETVQTLGAEATLRLSGSGAPYRTDGGHYLIDARFPAGLADPEEIARALRAHPGIVETGLFLGFGPDIVVGGASSR